MNRNDDMKKMTAILLLACIVLGFASCGNEEQEPSQTEASEIASRTEQSETSQEESKITLSSSSVNTPLAVDNWGTAAKYCTKNQSYVNVPVRITKIIRGKPAAEIVKKFTQNSTAYTYTEPDKNFEWAVAEYEINIDDFPVDKGGTDAAMTAFISGKGGKSLTDSSNRIFSSVCINIVGEERYFEGNVKGQTAFVMLEKKKDYVIALGEYEETQAFFSEQVS